jgi:glycosyltransferase involved in cell wall biosynthesis
VIAESPPLGTALNRAELLPHGSDALPTSGCRMRVLLFGNTDWYLFNFRRSLAIALRDAGHEVILTSPPGQYGEELRSLGFTWVPAPMQRRSLNPLRELWLVLWLRILIRRERPDVVHGFTIKCAVYGSLAARWAGLDATVSSVAGLGYVFTSSERLAMVLRPLVSTLLRAALGGRRARVILQNPDDVALFERARLVLPDCIRLIPGSGVNCDRFTPGARSVRDAVGPFRVVLPARLLWDKGVREYVEAARRLRAQRRQIVFLLAGEPDAGNPAAVPEQLLREWVAAGDVEWLGHVSDMPALFRAVDLVVLPSYREGLPKGLIEAAACGVPLVTTDVPGCREVVSHELDGLLVPARDAVALAEAIARLHEDAPLRRRLGAAARAKALAHFDERMINKRTIEIYEELIPQTYRVRL